MNKLFTIIATALSAAAFIYIYVPNIFVVSVVAVIVFVVACFLFWLEQFVSQNGSKIVSFLLFHITKDGRYRFDEKDIKYSRIGDEEWEFKKTYRIESRCKALYEYEDRFLWSADSDQCSINALERGQSIGRIREEGNWTFYAVKFDRSVSKGSIVDTGAIITNLKAKPEAVKPFLSCRVAEKTKRLRMTVVFPENSTPTNGKFSVYADGLRSSDAMVSSDDLVYNEGDRTFEKTIDYPRKGWRYVITWEDS